MDEGYIQLLLYTLLQGGGKRAPVRDLIRCRWLDQSAGLAFFGMFFCRVYQEKSGGESVKKGAP